MAMGALIPQATVVKGNSALRVAEMAVIVVSNSENSREPCFGVFICLAISFAGTIMEPCSLRVSVRQAEGDIVQIRGVPSL